MQHDNINGQDIDSVIIAPDGTQATEGLTPVERDLLERIDGLLRMDSGFAEQYPEARLIRIDSNRGLSDRDEGRFYLRYKHIGGMAEFWGNVANVSRVDIENGIVGVVR